ncbi:MAG: hypothetical protein UY05_C0045G0003 [Candidatus Peregrinibacteria bacterium GW2011_GWA2_47_7]|nr:MAG: hypothetical protein UY05_C0045G0003 [Candidatus Peregrinibacteria bacterium GW2011_GWA2_47_7]
MQKTCVQCSTTFTVTEDDTTFYAKLNIPEPTRCPNCRVIRRMMWRNDRTFYKRPCSKCNQTMVALYPADTKFPVYHPSEWWSDDWDPLSYGQAFDFNRPFFAQWHELMNKVPRLGIDIVNCENSDYCNYCGDDKNCYLDIAGEANEDCYYDLFTKYSKNCVDCTFAYNSELCYESINCYNCYNVQYGIYLENCNDCLFCFDLKGCKNCLFSYNLRQKEYHIFNEPYSKEEYVKKVNELGLGSYVATQKNLEQWLDMMQKAVHRDLYSLNSENCSGNDIKNSKNCQHCFNVVNCEDCKYLYDVLDAKDCYDLNYSLYKPEVACELISTLSMRYSAFSMASHYCSNALYVDQCNNSSNLFGCIALNRKQYCILNKQYSKEEYESLVPKIIDHMGKTGERTARARTSEESGSAGSERSELINKQWGEFFPAEISPFAYNETVAHEYFPFSKDQAAARGYRWKERDLKDYQPQTYVIGDTIDETTEKITDEILACIVCGKNFRIIPQELKFYKEHAIPVPRACPDCRHRERIKHRNPRYLWQKTCADCGATIQTSYPPGRMEKVLCEKCYLSHVY